MKKVIFSFLWISLFSQWLPAAAQDTLPGKTPWVHNLEALNYIYKDDYFIQPTYKVDKDWLHLEARYNYEDRETFSAWFGYNFAGGNKFKYSFTPMIGGVVGKTDGIAPGLEMTLEYFDFELFSEYEYVFDLNSYEGDFFYNWNAITYTPLDWLWFGVGSQWTKAYGTDLEVEPGLVIGGGYRWFGVTAYLYNMGFGDPYGIVSVEFRFPDE